jgi:type IV pilus assembly protein PilM
LDEVVWDFQPIGLDPNDPTDLLLDATIGMFAIKNDLAMKALSPYTSRSLNVDMIQSSPMALYNFLAFDQLDDDEIGDGLDDEQESVVSVCLGTDASDVVITNGKSIWTRNVPIGGGSFTKSLAKNLQLTYSKAEYVKRNVGTAPDKQAVIQAMHASFNDAVNEINRSLEYYQTLNRKATFKKILLAGNAGKLLGLQQYLAQNLGYEVSRVAGYNQLLASEAAESHLFKDNLPSFAVCYGLVVQQLGFAPLRTNLMPRAIVTDIIIREKKPWALVAAATVLLGMTLHFASATSVLQRVQNSDYDKSGNKVKQLETTDRTFKTEMETAITEFNQIDSLGKTLTSSVEGRITWLELLHALNTALPAGDDKGEANTNADDVNKGAKKITSESIEKESKVYVTSIDAVPVSSLAEWYAPLKQAMRYVPDKREYEYLQKNGISAVSSSGAADGTSDAQPANNALANLMKRKQSADAAAPSSDEEAGGTAAVVPVGDLPYEEMEEDILVAMMPGPADAANSSMRVVQITGYHYHNPQGFTNPQNGKDTGGELKDADGGAVYLRKTLLEKLKHGTVLLPSSPEPVTMKDLGISHPVLLYTPEIYEETVVHPEIQRLANPDDVAQYMSYMSSRLNAAGKTLPGRDEDDERIGRGGSNRTTGADTKGVDAVKKFARDLGVSEEITLRRFDFVIQFAWVETPPSVRAKKKDNANAASAAVPGTEAGNE